MKDELRPAVTLGLCLLIGVLLLGFGARDPAHPTAYWNFVAAPWALGLGVVGALAGAFGLQRMPQGPPVRPPFRRARLWVIDLVAAAVSVALFVRFADTARGGDFERVIFDITNGVALIKAEPLSPWMMGVLAKVAQALGMEPLPGLRFGLAVWGALGVVALRHLAWALAKDEPLRGAMGWAALLSAGSSALFFAHVETYTFAAVCMIFALASGVRAVDEAGARSVYPMLAMYTLACAFHMQMLCLGPAMLYAWVRRARLAPDAFEQKRLVAAALASAVLLAAIQWLCAQHPTPYPQHFGGGDGTMLVAWSQLGSTPHLFGVANELVLMGLGALAVMMVMAGRPRLRPPRSMITGIAAVGWLVFVSLWNPDLGAWRDWDLFAAVGWWLSAFALCLCLDEDAHPAAVWGLLGLCGLNLARTIPFVLENHAAGL